MAGGVRHRGAPLFKTRLHGFILGGIWRSAKNTSHPALGRFTSQFFASNKKSGGTGFV